MLVKSALRAPIVWMHAHKRRCIPACDQENGNRDSAANDANEFVQSLLNDMACTTSWRSLQLLIQDLIDKVQKIDAERCILLLPRPGGSKKGRKIVKRDFAAAYETVMRHYFSEHPLYCNEFSESDFEFHGLFSIEYTMLAAHVIPIFSIAKMLLVCGEFTLWSK
jgi:hypothetical protein